MEDIQLDEVPDGTVYYTTNIGIATFFGGWPVGAYLIAENFKALGEKRKAVATWVIAVLLFGIVLFLEFNSPYRSSGYVYSLILALIANFAARYFQSAKIKDHVSKGGGVYPNKRIIVVTLIGLAIVLAFSVAIFFIQDNMFTYSR